MGASRTRRSLRTPPCGALAIMNVSVCQEGLGLEVAGKEATDDQEHYMSKFTLASWYTDLEEVDRLSHTRAHAPRSETRLRDAQAQALSHCRNACTRIGMTLYYIATLRQTLASDDARPPSSTPQNGPMASCERKTSRRQRNGSGGQRRDVQFFRLLAAAQLM